MALERGDGLDVRSIGVNGSDVKDVDEFVGSGGGDDLRARNENRRVEKKRKRFSFVAIGPSRARLGNLLTPSRYLFQSKLSPSPPPASQRNAMVGC